MAQPAHLAQQTLQARLGPRGRPIDLVHLARQCLGDAGLEREILALFDTTIARCLARLELSASFDDLAASLHAIKGAAAGIGAWGIADLAQGAERELGEGRPVDPERIADIGLAVAEVRAFIAATLAEPG